MVNAAQRAKVLALLDSTRVLAVAVLADQQPHAGLLPFVVAPDYDGVVVHASRLARHTQGLQPGATVGLVIHRPDQPSADPMQLERLTLSATVERLPRETEAYEEARRRYLERFPTSEPTFGLADFSLYRLRFGQGRYIGGFAGAVTVRAEDLSPKPSP